MGKQKMVAVARDFRDICTGSNQAQFGTYGKDVDVSSIEKYNVSSEEDHQFNADVSSNRIFNLVIASRFNLTSNAHPPSSWNGYQKCIQFLTAVWASILE